MSVTTRKYFRSNSYDTLVAMCNEDEECADKYEFTFKNSLADYMNTVERIHISSADLDEGYYVIGVRARTLTESDTQTYGIAAAGAGLVLHDMARYWGDLGVETQAAEGGGGGSDGGNSGSGSAEPDPEESEPTPSPGSTSSPTAMATDESGGYVVLAPPGTPAPVVSDPDENAESAISGGGDDDQSGSRSTSSAGDGFRSSTSGGRSEGDSYDEDSSEDDERSSSAQAHAAVGGGAGFDDSGSPVEEISSGGGSSSADVVGREGDSSPGTSAVIAASVAGAAALIAILMCCVLRRRGIGGGGKGGPSGDIYARPYNGGRGLRRGVGGSSGRGARVFDGDSVIEDCEEEGSVMSVTTDNLDKSRHDLSSRRGRGGSGSSNGEGLALPGYATAVAMCEEEDDIARAGVIGAVTETSGFYAAVDPEAVSKLVGWGIGRDFARVALRQTDNDIPAALRMVAEGDMDARLALDHGEMARLGAEAAAQMTPAEAATAVADLR